jgi:hypothetical protein
VIAGHISCVNNDGTESLIPVCRHQGSSATEQLEDLKITGISLLAWQENILSARFLHYTEPKPNLGVQIRALSRRRGSAVGCVLDAPVAEALAGG